MSQMTTEGELGALGARLRIVTNFNEEIEGELFCLDMGTSNSVNSVVVCTRNESGNTDYVWLKTNIIQEVSAIVGPPAGAADDFPPHVDLRQLDAMAKKAEDQAAADARRYGVGVSEHAQEVFDAVSKTMEASWDGEDIVVFGVRISKPYDPLKNINGEDSKAVERVTKVLQNELARKTKSGAGAGRS
mmetsp:Transcript_23748/g.68694  ORF Transcript_23748/g.68694 Transcript_23748/m.68694 type:complete len:188 (-) Transcript_23748:59-622(-)